MSGTTMGLIIGNRGGFPDYLCENARTAMLKVLEEEGIKAIALGPHDTKFGAVETLDDATRCGELFKRHRIKKNVVGCHNENNSA